MRGPIPMGYEPKTQVDLDAMSRDKLRGKSDGAKYIGKRDFDKYKVLWPNDG